MQEREAIKAFDTTHLMVLKGGSAVDYEAAVHMGVDALEAQISLKECIENLDNPEFEHVTWTHAEVLKLLKEHVADYKERRRT